MTDDGQIVPASHADSLLLTRPDGTLLLIPTKFVLAIDAVLREAVENFDRAWVYRATCGDECGWHAMLARGQKATDRTAGGELADSPWWAVLSLAEKLKEATP